MCIVHSVWVAMIATALMPVDSLWATVNMTYYSVVTNVVDGNSVVITDRLSGGWPVGLPQTVRLDGIIAPELEEPLGEAARKRLNDLVLNKKLYFNEYLDGGIFHGACLFFVDGDRVRHPLNEDNCVNLIMVRDGMARWTGKFMSKGISTQKMEEAQRLAQAERNGVWGLSEASSSPPVPSLSPAVTNVSAASPPQEPRPVADLANTDAAPGAESPVDSPSRPRPVVPLAIGAGVLAALFLWVVFRKKP
jgi:endonuclease YncB( thermonuclease family)